MDSANMIAFLALLCLSFHNGVVSQLFDFGLEHSKNWGHIHNNDITIGDKFGDEKSANRASQETQNTLSNVVEITIEPPNYDNERSNRWLPLDESSSQNTLDWKMAFLCFSGALTLFLVIRCLLQIIPELCYILPRAIQLTRARRQQSTLDAHFITDNYSAPRCALSLDDPPPLSRTVRQNLIPAIAIPIHKVHLSSDSNEAPTEVQSPWMVRGREKCETPPPEYSPSMAEKKFKDYF